MRVLKINPDLLALGSEKRIAPAGIDPDQILQGGLAWVVVGFRWGGPGARKREGGGKKRAKERRDLSPEPSFFGGCGVLPVLTGKVT